MNQSEKLYKQTLNKIEQGKRVPLLRLIRLRCLDCCCYQMNEVKLCGAKDCILYKYRMGKNPVPRKMSEAQKKQMRKNLEKARTKLSK